MRGLRTTGVRLASVVLTAWVGLVACKSETDDPIAPAALDPTDVDPTSAQALDTADFCSYTTFDFVELEPPEPLPGDDGFGAKPDVVLETEVPIKSAIAAVLTDLGLEQRPEADLAVNLFYKIETETGVDLAEKCFGASECCWYGFWLGYSCDWLTVVEYDPGTVVIDIIDTKLDTVVFRGAMHGILIGTDLEGRIERAVANVFDEYPTAIEPCP